MLCNWQIEAISNVQSFKFCETQVRVQTKTIKIYLHTSYIVSSSLCKAVPEQSLMEKSLPLNKIIIVLENWTLEKRKEQRENNEIIILLLQWIVEF